MSTKICTKCNEEKSAEFYCKAKRGKLGLKAECKLCQAERFKKHYDKNQAEMQQRTREYTKLNPEKVKETLKNYRTANIEKIKVKDSLHHRAYYLKNKDAVLKRNKDWRLKNPETLKRLRDEYRDNNPDKMAAFSAASRSERSKSKPKWLTSEDKLKIREFYVLRNELVKETGEVYHVDHIIPLRNKVVCGSQ